MKPLLRQRDQRRNVAMAVITLVLVVVVAAATASAARVLRTSDSVRQPTPRLQLDRVERVSTTPTSWGAYAHVWTAPDADGRRCRFLQIDMRASSDFSPNRGGICAGQPTESDPIEVRLSWVPVAGGFPSVVAGSVAGNIKRVEIKSATATFAVALTDGFFVTELPSSGTAGTLPTTDGPYVIVAYDDRGLAVRRIDLTELVNSVRE